MSRPYTPSGRFDTDYEVKDIHDAITKDLTNPVGTSVLWYVWNASASTADPIYDVGSNPITNQNSFSTATTMAGNIGERTITVVSTANVKVNMSASGTGLGANAVVKGISGTTVTVNVDNAASIAAGTAVTFTKAGNTATAPTTTMTGVVATNTITVVSTSGVVVGMAAIGAGLDNGALVRSISGHVVTLTLDNKDNITAGTAVTFSNEGRQWKSPVKVPVIRAVLKEGSTNMVQQGFYNADRIHFTIDHDVLVNTIPEMLSKLDPLNSEDPDPLNRDRIVWKDQVYRPIQNNYSGIIGEKFTLLSFECQQIMPEELVNDPQFQNYAS